MSGLYCRERDPYGAGTGGYTESRMQCIGGLSWQLRAGDSGDPACKAF